MVKGTGKASLKLPYLKVKAGGTADLRPILMDFCNMQLSADELLRFYKRCRIIHTNKGEEEGWDQICRTRNAPGTDFNLTSKLENLRVLWEALEKSKHEYKARLQQFSDGIVDLESINGVLHEKLNQRGMNLIFEPSNDPLDPGINYRFRSSTLEDYLDTIILLIFLTRQGNMFSRVRVCPYCSTCFLTENTKRKFCSDRHRLTHHYEKRRKKSQKSNLK